MLLFLILVFLLFFIFLTFIFFLIITIFTGAPYLGMQKSRVEKLVKIAEVKKGDIAVDLGSGDGRIVIAMAQKGAIAHGFEINPFYFLLSKIKIYNAKVSGKAFVHWKNYWNEDLSKFNIVTVYGISYIMEKLEIKLKKDLKKGAKVISSSYSFKNWKPVRKKDFIFVYII